MASGNSWWSNRERRSLGGKKVTISRRKSEYGQNLSPFLVKCRPYTQRSQTRFITKDGPDASWYDILSFVLNALLKQNYCKFYVLKGELLAQGCQVAFPVIKWKPELGFKTQVAQIQILHTIFFFFFFNFNVCYISLSTTTTTQATTPSPLTSHPWPPRVCIPYLLHSILLWNWIHSKVNLLQIETGFQRKACKKFCLAKETQMQEYRFILSYIVRIYLIILTAC